MKITVTGSLGHISKPLIQKLIAAGHDVKVVSSTAERASEIEALGAEAAIGKVEDVTFLSDAFAGADAVYTMIPPTFQTADWKKHIATIGANYTEALRNSGVKSVVNLSSIGAHLPEGCGPVSGLYYAEKSLNSLVEVNIKHLRPGFFYYNFYSNIPLIQNMGILGSNYGADVRLLMADVSEIAEAAFEELNTLQFEGKSHRYIVSDIRTPQEVAKAIGHEIGKPDLKWVQFSDNDLLNAMVQQGLPHEIAANFVEMGAAVNSGKMFEDYKSDQPTGKIRIEDFAKEFARAYAAPVEH